MDRADSAQSAPAGQFRNATGATKWSACSWAVMPSVTLQVQLPPDPMLSAEKLAGITGRAHVTKQIAWLEEHGWHFELAADGSLIVGSLYAHLRLAGLNPADVVLPDIPPGFDLSRTR